MTNGMKRPRGSKWSHEETLVLAELKKETFFNKRRGKLVWKEIAQTISSRFFDQKRSHAPHWQIDEDELSSMKLDTAYRQDWYSIVKQVCSQRKRKEKGDCDLITMKRSDTCSSPFAVRQEPTPGIDSLYETAPVSISEPRVNITALDAYHEQSTSVNANISTRPSLEVEKLSPEDESRRLKREIDALILELAQLRQRRQVTEQDQIGYQNQDRTRQPPREVVSKFSLTSIPLLALSVSLKEVLQDEVTVEHFSKAEQDGIDCELIVPRSRSLSPKFSSNGQRLGAMNSAGFNDFDPLEPSTFLISTPFIPEMDFLEFDLSPAIWKDGLRK